MVCLSVWLVKIMLFISFLLDKIYLCMGGFANYCRSFTSLWCVKTAIINSTTSIVFQFTYSIKILHSYIHWECVIYTFIHIWIVRFNHKSFYQSYVDQQLLLVLHLLLKIEELIKCRHHFCEVKVAIFYQNLTKLTCIPTLYIVQNWSLFANTII